MSPSLFLVEIRKQFVTKIREDKALTLLSLKVLKEQGNLNRQADVIESNKQVTSLSLQALKEQSNLINVEAY